MLRCCSLQGRVLLLVLALPVIAGLAGCGSGTVATPIPISPPPPVTYTLTGTVSAGLQPVSGATIQLYTAGNSGNGSAATAMLTTPVTTNSTGNFSLTINYSCNNSTDQMYVVATGGNPGLTTTTTNNDALVLTTVLGSCGTLTSISSVTINEVTTVAAAYALTPFISLTATAPYFSIGASASNTLGFSTAFTNAKLLASITTGKVGTFASGLSIESGKLNALADALAPCDNSAGSSSTACAALFVAATPQGGAPPASNTLAALLTVIKHPGDVHIAGNGYIWGLIGTTPPFATTLTHSPSDWTMTLTITNGGINNPTALALDKSGNVWVANYGGSLSAFSPQGTAYSSSPFGSGTLNECFGLAIDTSDNIWVSNFELPTHSLPHGALVKFTSTGSIVTNTSNNSPYFHDSSIDFPTGIAVDTNGNVAIANSANSSATIYSSGGSVVSSGLAAGNSAFPAGVAFDSAHGIWLANLGDGYVTHVGSSNTLLAHPSCCGGTAGVALDSFGNAWVSDYYGSQVVGVTSTGANITSTTGGGISGSQPVGIAVDAAQNIWVADGNTHFTALAATTGTAISPLSGYGIDANLTSARTIAPDASGNIWVSDFSANKVVLFFGLATPTKTPVQPVPTAP